MTVEKVEVIEAETLLTTPPRYPDAKDSTKVLPAERSVEDVAGRVVKVQHLMKTVLVKDEHYGVIPGTKKPTLYQPGLSCSGSCLNSRQASSSTPQTWTAVIVSTR